MVCGEGKRIRKMREYSSLVHYVVVVEEVYGLLLSLGSRRYEDVAAFFCVHEMSEPLVNCGGSHEFMCEGA